MTSTWGLDTTADGVRVYGELDMDSAESFREQLSAALCERWGTSFTSFLIDLSGVTFMDSSGLRALRKALDLGSGKDVVVLTSRQVFKLLDLAGLADHPLPNIEVRPPR